MVAHVLGEAEGALGVDRSDKVYDHSSRHFLRTCFPIPACWR